jgi:hypothetical protein
LDRWIMDQWLDRWIDDWDLWLDGSIIVINDWMDWLYWKEDRWLDKWVNDWIDRSRINDWYRWIDDWDKWLDGLMIEWLIEIYNKMKFMIDQNSG